MPLMHGRGDYPPPSALSRAWRTRRSLFPVTQWGNAAARNGWPAMPLSAKLFTVVTVLTEVQGRWLY